MLQHSDDDKSRIKRQRTKEAIALAMQSRWKEAVDANKDILDISPNDVEAYNRLGRALVELGEFNQAKEAYSRTLELDPSNEIARKNIQRLSTLKVEQAPSKDHHKIALDVFAGESTKVGIVELFEAAPAETLAKMSAGDEVYLNVDGQKLTVQNSQGEQLGKVDPKHGLRLAKLIDGGNKYESAIAAISEGRVKVVIREIYQAPKQVGRLSFPLKAVEVFRPYTRQGLFRDRIEEEAMGEETPEEELAEEYEVEGEATPEEADAVRGQLEADTGDEGLEDR